MSGNQQHSKRTNADQVQHINLTLEIMERKEFRDIVQKRYEFLLRKDRTSSETEELNAIFNLKKAIKQTKFARKCSFLGKGMNAGYVFRNGEMYFKREKDLLDHLRGLGDANYNDATDEFILNEAYNVGDYYYTEWEDEDDYQYELINGVLTEIE